MLVATRLAEAGIERDKGDDVLDLTAVDLDDLAQALEDHSYGHSWWLDPNTGEVVLWSDYFEEQGEPDPEVRGLRPIDPVPSHEGYEEMQDFIDRVRDLQAGRRLERAIEGRGLENDTVVTALPVAQEDVDQRRKPVLVRAETEGLLVG